MKRFQEQFEKKAAAVKMSSVERTDLKERLVAYIEYHPLPAELKKTKAAAPAHISSEPFISLALPWATLLRSSIVAAGLLLVVVPIIAERSVPGDALYAVKVQFNEELRSTLTFDQYQKIEWETERLNRRIAEARLLASEGRLTEEVEAEVAEAVKEHSNTAKREIEELRTIDADEAAIASIALDTTLEVQASSFEVEEEADEDMSLATVVAKPKNLIADAINESRDPVNPAAATTTPSYEKLSARIEQNTTRIYELQKTIGGIATPEQLTDIERRITDIERAIVEATEMFETDELSARKQLVDVLQRTQKLIVYMTEIEVIETVDIEDIVPRVLTEEEQATLTEELVAALEAKRDTLIDLEAVSEAAVAEKSAIAVSEIDAALDLVSTSSFRVFETAANEAMQLADDFIASQIAPEVTLEPEPVRSTTTPVIVPPAATSTSSSTDEGVATTTATGTVDTVE